MKSGNGKNTVVWVIVGIVVLALAAAGIYWAVTSGNDTTTPQKTDESAMTDTTQQQPADHAASEAVTIVYGNDGFPSETFMVKAGGTVTVKNESDHDLEFSSGPHPTHTDEPELNMDVLAPGKSGSFKVTKIGTWSFHNHLKEQDTGSLMVME